VRFTRSARKHGIAPDEVRRVLAAPLRSVEQGELVLHIGLTERRDLLEVVVAPGDPVTVLHAMRLRPVNYRHLQADPPATPGPGWGCRGRACEARGREAGRAAGT
jgi:hypothetical protein